MLFVEMHRTCVEVIVCALVREIAEPRHISGGVETPIVALRARAGDRVSRQSPPRLAVGASQMEVRRCPASTPDRVSRASRPRQ